MSRTLWSSLALALVLNIGMVEVAGARLTASSVHPRKAAAKPPASKVPREKGNRSVGTDHEFDGSEVHGRHLVPTEAAVRVENDKNLFDLVFGRKDFEDRRSEDRRRTN